MELAEPEGADPDLFDLVSVSRVAKKTRRDRRTVERVLGAYRQQIMRAMAGLQIIVNPGAVWPDDAPTPLATAARQWENDDDAIPDLTRFNDVDPLRRPVWRIDALTEAIAVDLGLDYDTVEQIWCDAIDTTPHKYVLSVRFPKERDIEDRLEQALKIGRFDNDEVMTVVGVAERQFRLPSGRIVDLVIGDDRHWRVVEVKRDTIGTEAVDQLLGYLDEIETMDRPPTDGLLVGFGITTAAATRLAELEWRINYLPWPLAIESDDWDLGPDLYADQRS